MSADDHRLITNCLKGDAAAFGELVRRYQERVYHTAYRLIGNAEDAQDVAQETFINAYQSLDGFKGNASFFTWLYRIAVNTAISHKRKRRLALVRMDGGQNGQTASEPADASETSRPGHALEQAEEESRVRRALDRLSPEHRAVLMLKEMEDQKYEEIAEVLNVPVGTVRSRLHRARMELREILEQDATEHAG